MTIKDVLEAYAASETVYDHAPHRTTGGACPLQVATGCPEDYVFNASLRGLSHQDSETIMLWADTGRWRIDSDSE